MVILISGPSSMIAGMAAGFCGSGSRTLATFCAGAGVGVTIGFDGGIAAVEEAGIGAGAGGLAKGIEISAGLGNSTLGSGTCSIEASIEFTVDGASGLDSSPELSGFSDFFNHENALFKKPFLIISL